MALNACAQRFQVLGSTYLTVELNCPISKTQILTTVASPVHLYLALDNSGSMAGAALNNAKAAVNDFLEKSAAPDSMIDLDSIHLLVFNHETQDIDLTGCDVETMKAKVSGITAYGGTSFQEVLQAMQRLAAAGTGQAATGQQYFVVFFTDGQDGCFLGPKFKDDALAAFRKAFDAVEATCQVHSLGFQQYHDAAFLSALTLCGTEQGTFQYIEDTTLQLQPAVDNIQQVLAECAGSTSARVRAKIQAPTTNPLLAPIPIVLRAELPAAATPDAGAAAAPAEVAATTPTPIPTPTTITYTGDLYMDQAWADALPDVGQVLLMSVESIGDVELQVPAPQEPSLQDLAPLAVALLRRRIIHWTDSIANERLGRQQIQRIKDLELAACKAQLQGILPRLNKQPATSRSAIRAAKSAIMEAAQLCNQFETGVLVPALAGTLTNQRIAALNDLAYRNITRSGLKSALMKRAGANVDLMDQIDTQVEEELARLQLSGVGEDSLREFGTCALSCQNYLEALQAGDCLCLALDIERPEAAIMDSSRLRIKALHPTRVTCESFLDAVSFSLTCGSGAMDDTQVHGGFQLNTQGQVVPGEGREPITGCLPLYINPQHWAVARHRIKPLLGWMCTLDVLGYSGEQLATVPFLVLAKALEDVRQAPSEFRQWVADQVLETCCAVYGMRKKILLAELLAEGAEGGAPLRYLAGPEQRTVDVVASGRVMLMRLLCAVKEGNVKLTAEDVAGLQRALTEEELRRWPGQELPSANDAAFDSVVARVLAACDKQTAPALSTGAGSWVQQAVEEVLGREGAETMESAEVLRELEGAVEELVQRADWGREEGALWELPEVQRLGKAYEGRVVRLMQLLEDVQKVAGVAAAEAPPASLAKLPDQVVAALLVQIMQGTKNADRREYITAGLYLDPYLQPQEILSRMYKQVVMAKVKALVSTLQNERYLRRSLAMGSAFAAAATRQEAAVAIKGWHVGRELAHLLQALLQPTTAIPDVKMELLMSWEEAGVKLRADKPRKDGCEVAAATWKPKGGWRPKRQRVFRFLKVWHGEVVPLERAVQLFGAVVGEQYLQAQYGRGFADRM